MNEAAIPFFKDIYPKVVSLTSRFKNYEQLNLEYNQYPSRTIDIVPSNRFERRILMGLLLTKQFEPDKYEERKKEYLQSLSGLTRFNESSNDKTFMRELKYLTR